MSISFEEMTEYNFGAWNIILNGNTVDRYFTEEKAKRRLEYLHSRSWGKDAVIVYKGSPTIEKA